MLLAVVATVTFAVWMRSQVPGEQVGGLPVGEVAPEIRVAGWLNGAPPSDASRQVVVINSWFTTCPHCHSRAPEIVSLYRKFHNRGVVFIGLTYEPPQMLDQIKASVSDMEMTWPNGYGADKTLMDLKAEFFPGYWVIGADGRIAWNGDSKESLEQGIEDALAQAPPRG